MIKKILKNKLLLAKLFFSFYNIGIILILNLFFDGKDSGRLLYSQGVVLLLAGISRLGSDFYWVSSKKEKIIISKFEKLYFILLPVLTVGIYSIFFTPLHKDIFWIFLSVVLVNLFVFLGRIYQENGKHIYSLFTLSLGPTFLIVPFFWFLRDVSIYIIMAISMLLVLFILILLNKPKIEFEYDDDSLKKRVHFFPMIIYGILNQNLMQVLSGVLGYKEYAAILVLFQRFSGLALWPQIFHMQTELKKIRDSLNDLKVFNNYIISYLTKHLQELLFYSCIVIVVSVSFIYYKIGYLKIDIVIASVLILLASLINTSLGFIQYQIGISKNGMKSFVIMMISIVLGFMLSFTIKNNYLSLAVIYLIYHSVTHAANYLIVSNWLKNVR